MVARGGAGVEEAKGMGSVHRCRDKPAGRGCRIDERRRRDGDTSAPPNAACIRWRADRWISGLPAPPFAAVWLP